MLDPEMLRRMGGALAAATELSVTVLVGAFFGAWLDGRLQTAPYLLLFLALAGLLAGLVRLTRWYQSADAKDDAQEDDVLDSEPHDDRP